MQNYTEMHGQQNLKSNNGTLFSTSTEYLGNEHFCCNKKLILLATQYLPIDSYSRNRLCSQLGTILILVPSGA